MEYSFNEAVAGYASIIEAAMANYELEAILEGADGSDSATDNTADTQNPGETKEISKKDGCLALAVKAVSEILSKTLAKNGECVDYAKALIGNTKELTSDKIKEYASKNGSDLNLKMQAFSSKFLEGANALIDVAKDATKVLENLDGDTTKISEGVDKFNSACAESTDAEDFTVDACKKACKTILDTRDAITEMQKATNSVAEKANGKDASVVTTSINAIKDVAEGLAKIMDTVCNGLSFVKDATGCCDKAEEPGAEDNAKEDADAVDPRVIKAQKLEEAAKALRLIEEDATAVERIDPKVFIDAAMIMAEDTEYMKTSGTTDQGEPADDKSEGNTGEYDPTVNGANKDNSNPDMKEIKDLAGNKGVQILTDDDGCETCVECSVFGF